jgi:hypothetical protein
LGLAVDILGVKESGLMCLVAGCGFDEGLVRLLGAAGLLDRVPAIMGSHEGAGGGG